MVRSRSIVFIDADFRESERIKVGKVTVDNKSVFIDADFRESESVR